MATGPPSPRRSPSPRSGRWRRACCSGGGASPRPWPTPSRPSRDGHGISRGLSKSPSAMRRLVEASHSGGLDKEKRHGQLATDTAARSLRHELLGPARGRSRVRRRLAGAPPGRAARPRAPARPGHVRPAGVRRSGPAALWPARRHRDPARGGRGHHRAEPRRAVRPALPAHAPDPRPLAARLARGPAGRRAPADLGGGDRRRLRDPRRPPPRVGRQGAPRADDRRPGGLVTPLFDDPQERSTAMSMPPIVSPEEWEAARLELLVKEKELTRARDALAAERRRMPRMAVDKQYRFEGPNGPASLLDLFEGRRQLIVYRAFYGPDITTYAEGGACPQRACVGCSFVADQIAHPAHLNARDTTLAFVSRAPQADIHDLKKRMGWELIPWYTITDDFDEDFGVREWHGHNAFIREGDRIFRTYFIDS